MAEEERVDDCISEAYEAWQLRNYEGRIYARTEDDVQEVVRRAMMYAPKESSEAFEASISGESDETPGVETGVSRSGRVGVSSPGSASGSIAADARSPRLLREKSACFSPEFAFFRPARLPVNRARHAREPSARVCVRPLGDARAAVRSLRAPLVPRAPAIAFDNNAILAEKAKSEGVFFSREIRRDDRSSYVRTSRKKYIAVRSGKMVPAEVRGRIVPNRR